MCDNAPWRTLAPTTIADYKLRTPLSQDGQARLVFDVHFNIDVDHREDGRPVDTIGLAGWSSHHSQPESVDLITNITAASRPMCNHCVMEED